LFAFYKKTNNQTKNDFSHQESHKVCFLYLKWLAAVGERNDFSSCCQHEHVAAEAVAAAMTGRPFLGKLTEPRIH
jgi:hypothetical protein